MTSLPQPLTNRIPTHKDLPRALPRLAAALLRTARPRQWMKNVLVFAAPGAAGALTVPTQLANALTAFTVLCAAASAVYLLNDALDAVQDRAHPVKRHRPIAAGIVPRPLAFAFATVLATAALLMAQAALGAKTMGAVGLYLAVTTCYSCQLKHIPVLDIVILACGFVLRAVIGALATSVPVSLWFLTVIGFGSLFIAAGKRSAELATLREGAAGHRQALTAYTRPFLQHIQTLAALVAIVTYFLWAFGMAAAPTQAAHTSAIVHSSTWLQASTIAFVLMLLRYSSHVAAGGGGAPEEIVLRDRLLQAAALIWTILFAVGVYG
ncbi:decaprenyl-phosphate phosphoribosyltransferase [Streptomyces chartreusis]|uniref:decaprenyl-phosphate phosphoribosyltransferase n=1 Tax=Streptomyces chartreusis TaxID=1969 RepID=UPI00380C9B3B